MRIPTRRGAIFGLLLLFATPALAESLDSIRVSVASRLFPSLLAADTQLEQKADSDDRLLILVVYLDSREMAERASEELTRVSNIRKMSLDVRVIPLDSLPLYQEQSIAGIFIGNKLEQNISLALGFARERSIITFSPYPGDVERGVAGGIVVRDRILPYINLKTLRDASIQLRPFYLKVAEKYEPK